MNQIVIIALRKPYTFVVLSILIVIFGVRAIRHTPTDVFPTIKIPVISVVWAYAGMLPLDVSGRITFYFERFLTSTVEGIADIVSQAYYGHGVRIRQERRHFLSCYTNHDEITKQPQLKLVG